MAMLRATTPAIPPIKELQKLFFSEDACVNYLMRYGVFYDVITCKKCGLALKLDFGRLSFRCSARTCRTEYSYRIFTLFYGSKLDCSEILHLGYLWLTGATWTVTQIITGHSEKVITAFYGHFRILVASMLEDVDQVIGGDGVEVQVDETKLGKRKFNRGHRVEGVWVIVGVERTCERKVFLLQVEDRTATTINDIIRKHVLPGSIIVTDMWRGYSSLSSKLGFAHYTVNHSQTFRDDETGACTNMAEGTNNALKMKIPPRNRVREHMEEHLAEFIWRRVHAKELWCAFLDAIKDINYSYD